MWTVAEKSCKRYYILLTETPQRPHRALDGRTPAAEVLN
jgi:hypothetical protein